MEKIKNMERKRKKMKMSKPLSSQAKEMIQNLFEYFEKKWKDLILIDRPVAEEVAIALKLSRSTVYKVLKEGRDLKNDPEGPKRFSSPKPKHKFVTGEPHVRWVTGVDEYSIDVIRRTIYESYIKEGLNLTIIKLAKKLKDEEIFEGSCASLARVLRSIHIKSVKINNSTRILFESEKISCPRMNYLRQIIKFRREKRNIVFLDGIGINLRSLEKTQTSSTSTSNSPYNNAPSIDQRLIIAYTADENGFVNWLPIHNTDTNTETEDIKEHTFNNWITNRLIPSLPNKCVLVFDNIIYQNCFQERKLPSKSDPKEDIKKWLKDNNVEFSDDMSKSKLLQIIKQNEEEYRKQNICKVFNNYEHDLLITPPSHPDLNPIKKIWNIVKGSIASENIKCDATNVEIILQNKFESISAETLKSIWDDVTAVEIDYYEKGLRFKSMLENANLKINEYESDSDSSNKDDYGAMNISCE